MRTNDGGPAFPSHGSMGEVVQEGLSLRDYMAAKAMPMVAAQFYSTGQHLVGGTVAQLAAKIAYEFADAMLAARGEA